MDESTVTIQVPCLTTDHHLLIPGYPRTEDFSEVYKNSYVNCHFTALAEIEGSWYAAGCDQRHVIRLFSSTDGYSWGELDLSAAYINNPQDRFDAPAGILPGIGSEEILIITKNGFVISVPDCPYCIEASQFSDQPVDNVWKEESDIVWKDDSGIVHHTTAEQLVHHRVTWPWVHKHRATLVNLRSGRENDEDPLPFGWAVPKEAFSIILRALPKDAYIALMDTTAKSADDIARNARKNGWSNCRSMGSIKMVLTY